MMIQSWMEQNSHWPKRYKLMNEQFQRTIELIGIDNINILKNRRVAVFGVGGVGGHAAEALCRSAIGAIDVFDGDIVDITNINRQLIATHKTIGRNKVDVIKERLLEINPDIVINAYKIFYLPDTADDVNLSCYDYVIDAVDTITAKLELAVRCKALNVPLICSMGAANKLDATAFEVADIYETSVCPVARIMRKELRERGIDSLKVVYSKEVPVKKEKPPSSISYVPPVAGLILAGEVIRDLIDPPLT